MARGSKDASAAAKKKSKKADKSKKKKKSKKQTKAEAAAAAKKARKSNKGDKDKSKKKKKKRKRYSYSYSESEFDFDEISSDVKVDHSSDEDYEPARKKARRKGKHAASYDDSDDGESRSAKKKKVPLTLPSKKGNKSGGKGKASKSAATAGASGKKKKKKSLPVKKVTNKALNSWAPMSRSNKEFVHSIVDAAMPYVLSDVHGEAKRARAYEHMVRAATRVELKLERLAVPTHKLPSLSSLREKNHALEDKVFVTTYELNNLKKEMSSVQTDLIQLQRTQEALEAEVEEMRAEAREGRGLHELLLGEGAGEDTQRLRAAQRRLANEPSSLPSAVGLLATTSTSVAGASAAATATTSATEPQGSSGMYGEGVVFRGATGGQSGGGGVGGYDPSEDEELVRLKGSLSRKLQRLEANMRSAAPALADVSSVHTALLSYAQRERVLEPSELTALQLES